MTRHTKHEKRFRTGRQRQLAAIMVIITTVLLCAYAFAGLRPFSSARTLELNVANAYQLKSGDPVRVAGIRVGRVKGVKAGPGGTALVDLALEDDDLKIASDARFIVRTRLFVEGSFYVEVQPGSPAAGALDTSKTVPLDRTTGPVQLDQVISMLIQPTRESLRGLVHESNIALTPDAPGPVPLRRAIDQLRHALPPARVTAKSLRGQRAGDLGRTIRSGASLTTQLAQDPATLANLVTNTRRTADALAADDRALGGVLREFAGLMRSAPGDLPAIDRGLVSVRRLASASAPALVALPRTAPAITALLRELRLLSAPSLLPRTLRLARPVLAAIPELGLRLDELTSEYAPVLSCLQERVVPVLEDTVPDGKFSTGEPVWKEILYLTASLAGTSPGFDGNGTTIRFSPSWGSSQVTGRLPGLANLVSSTGAPEGVRPAAPWPDQPVFRPDVGCTDTPRADLGGGIQSDTPLEGMRRVARKPLLSPDALHNLLARLAAPPPKAKRDASPVKRPALERPALERPALERPALKRMEPKRPADHSDPVKPIVDDVQSSVNGLLDYLLGPTKKEGGG